MRILDLSGKWTARIKGREDAAAVLPGTLDQNKIGFPDEGKNQWQPECNSENNSELAGNNRILTRLTRNFTYDGPAYFTKKITVNETQAERVFLDVERSRELSLTVNGQPVSACTPGTISTPYSFEVSSVLKRGENTVVLCCDNSYPNWPRDAIIYSSSASDETQTNWNGLLGYLRLRFENENFISSVRVYPGEKTADIIVELDCAVAYNGTLKLQSEAFVCSASECVSLPVGRHCVHVKGIALSDNARRWDEDEGILHCLSVEGDGLETFSVRFGLRTFDGRDGKLALNGRHIFLRGETNCCVFPETGYMPMTVEEWKKVLSVYKSYGVNCMRFHSHCPPGAAFTAADEMGMLLQPELSHWDTKTAFENDNSWNYYQTETRRILLTYANHPSFVMMTWGNELGAGTLGYKRMTLLLQMAKQIDATRLFAIGSNTFYGKIGPDPSSDFYTSSGFYDIQTRGTSAMMQGYINQKYPDTKENFNRVFAQIREEYQKPVFSFEVGQYEILPDFDEWNEHTGVTCPNNYINIKERVEKLGFMPGWKKRVEASGELSFLAYREEIESVLRTEACSGISLLGLQDFPGQGTALVGMLNSHLRPKPFRFAQPERFHKFFSDIVPLALYDKYAWLNSEQLRVEVKIANYSRRDLVDVCTVCLTDGDAVISEQKLPQKVYPCGKLTTAGEAAFSLDCVSVSKKLTIAVSINTALNEYPVWVYQDNALTCPDTVLITKSADEAIRALKNGKNVFLSPPAVKEYFPNSIQTQFTTDFWSVGTFVNQEGFMGCLLDPAHPVFSEFPTEFHSNWQWWPMCQGRAIVLPYGMEPLVTALDCYARMRNMGMLLEARVEKGKLIISSMGLHEKTGYPEVRALIRSIVHYMESNAFCPKREISVEALKEMVD